MLKTKAKVYIDTNFLLIPGNFMVDVFAEIEKLMEVPYELCIFKKSIKELNKVLETGSSKDKRAARLAILMIKQKTNSTKVLNFGLKTKALKILTSFSNKYVDDLIFFRAKKGDYVATQDKELKKRLKQKNIKIITLKQKKYLRIENVL